MNRPKINIILLFFCIPSLITLSQENKIDSLLVILKTEKQDTNTVRILCELSEESSDNKDVFQYAQQALQLAEKLFSSSNDKKVSIVLKKYMAGALNNIGYAQSKQGNIPQALESYHKSLKIFEETGDKEGVIDLLNNIGIIYQNQGDIQQALEYFNRSLIIGEEIGNKIGISYSLNNIGVIYQRENNFHKAIEYYDKSLKIREEIGDKEGIGFSLNNIGVIYKIEAERESSHLNLKDSLFNKALEYFLRSLNVQEAIKNNEGIAIAFNNIGFIYLRQNNIKKAEEYCNRSLQISKQYDFPANIRNASELLSKIYEKQGKYKEAYEIYQVFKKMADSVSNVETRKSAVKKQMQYQFEKKESLMKAEQEKERAVAEEKNRKQKIITWSVVCGLLLVILFAGFIFRSLRITRKQKQIIEVQKTEVEKSKHIIEEKNKDITDSINYARRIQQAKLPKKEDIYSALPNCFVLYKPKDIVSGDFYYFQAHPRPLPLGGENEKQQVLPNGEDLGGALFFIASADCTGHGVPGAFMSMIGSDKLEDAVSQSADTSEILSLLNKGIKTALKQSDSNESTRDGMDIALCSVDTNARVVKYAGANRPIWIIRKTPLSPNSPPYQGGDKGMVLEEIKATKKAIGGFTEDSQHFDTHVIQLQQGDTFYISTDGYADTFGKNGKKLMTKTFKEILLSIQDKTMKEQEQHLDNFIEDWKGGTEQVDDILVIGVRL